MSEIPKDAEADTEGISESPPVAVRGLVDSDRAAAILGIGRVRIRSWMWRKKKGSGGLPKRFPTPLEEQINGGYVWRVEDIEQFADDPVFKAMLEQGEDQL